MSGVTRGCIVFPKVTSRAYGNLPKLWYSIWRFECKLSAILFVISIININSTVNKAKQSGEKLASIPQTKLVRGAFLFALLLF